MMIDERIYLNQAVKQLEESLEAASKIISKDSGIDIEEVKATLRTPGVVTIASPTVKVLKIKKEIPTVIEYNGRRYVLDDRNR
jgi:hypothetical protein